MNSINEKPLLFVGIARCGADINTNVNLLRKNIGIYNNIMKEFSVIYQHVYFIDVNDIISDIDNAYIDGVHFNEPAHRELFNYLDEKITGYYF